MSIFQLLFKSPAAVSGSVVLATKLGPQVHSIRRESMLLDEEEKDILEFMDFKWGPKGRTTQRESKRHSVNGSHLLIR